jgi:hypothetical protein
MKSPVKDLISQVITLLDSNVTVTHDKRGSETLNAYTSVPNGKQSFMLVRLVSSEDISTKDVYLEQGILAIDVVDRTKEDNASMEFVYDVLNEIEGLLAPSFGYRPTSGANGATVSFYKLGRTNTDQDYQAGFAKVNHMTLEVNYRLQYTG